MNPNAADQPPASFALAPQQHGLWYVQQLAPDCGAYHLVFSFRLEGTTLTSKQVADVLEGLIADYPVLSTRLDDGQVPRQRCVPAVQPRIHWVQINDTEVNLKERVRADTRVAFDLLVAPLWRVHVYETAPECYVIAVVTHHLLLDFWSLGLLLSEVGARLGVLPQDQVGIDGNGYFAFADAQSKQVHPSALAYWKNALNQYPEVHGLPLDAARPPVQSYSGRSQSFALSVQSSNAVRKIAQRHHATPFMVLLAAYFAWLHRLSGDRDVVVASPVAGRTQSGQRRMLGQFVNTLPLRARIDPETPFSTLLEQVRSTVIDGLRHQECPYSSLIEALSPKRDPSFPPVVQLGFSWERLPLMAEFAPFFLPDHSVTRTQCGERHFGGITLRPFAVPQQEGQLELLMEMGGEVDGAYVGVLKYNDVLFEDSTIEAWLHSWSIFVEGIEHNESTPVGALPMTDGTQLPPTATRGRHVALPALHTLDWIEACAQKNPDSVAVSDDTTEWTYAQLIARAQAVGAHLQSLGVVAGDHVGLMLDRSADLLATILGIWYAGGAYVPLDPSFPKERLSMIAQDAGLSALVTQSQWQTLWPEVKARVVLDEFTTAPSTRLNRASRSAHAYLIYTSGSTGKPKGVRVGHRSVVNFLSGMTHLPWAPQALGSDTRLLAVTTPAFDISVLELMLPLLVGGRVVLCEQAVLIDGVRLAQCMRERDINVMQATPATWRMLLQAGWEGRESLVALCGGEPLPSALASALHTRTAALWNMYGPTETTVWSTAVRINPNEPIHLGPPIANTQLYVLDEQQRPVPPGVMGELWIGGDGLAVDYWQRPELTDQRFCYPLDEAGVCNQRRLYRTGDRVRFKPNGQLEHHGRLDFQVKLRGYRIELGEIEAAIKRLPHIQEAVVIVREDQPGDQRLVAYVVPVDNEVLAMDMTQIRASLSQTLPAYMLPSAWVQLEALPLTPNKKVDRNALPAPQPLGHRASVIAPRDDVEIQLVRLFEQILNVSPIGIEDNFFDLGGHSLLAVRLISEIKRIFNQSLAVTEVLTHGCVSALAQRLRSGTDPVTASLVVTLRQGVSGQAVSTSRATDSDLNPLWLFHPIGGTVFCYLELTRHLDSGRCVHAIQAPGLAQSGEAEVTVEAMAARYVEALRQKQPNGPYLLGGWCFGGVIAYEAARQLRAMNQIVEGVILIDTRAPVPENVPSDGDDATLLSWFARDLAVPYGKTLNIDPDALRALAPDAMFDDVLRRAKRLHILADDADRDQLYRYFEVYIANAMALQMYFPPAEAVPVMLVRAQDEPAASWGPTLGWATLAPHTLTQVELPGDHNSIMYAPHAKEVGATIERAYGSSDLMSQNFSLNRQAA